MKIDEKWDKRFLNLARHVSKWSKDPSTQVAAILVDENRRVVSLGYNGFAAGVKDTHERLSHRDTKLKLVIHAEINALIFAQRSLKGCTLYTWPFLTCAPCASIMIQGGVSRVVAPWSDNPRWLADFELARQVFDEAGVEVDFYLIKETENDSHSERVGKNYPLRTRYSRSALSAFFRKASGLCKWRL